MDSEVDATSSSDLANPGAVYVNSESFYWWFLSLPRKQTSSWRLFQYVVAMWFKKFDACLNSLVFSVICECVPTPWSWLLWWWLTADLHSPPENTDGSGSSYFFLSDQLSPTTLTFLQYSLFSISWLISMIHQILFITLAVLKTSTIIWLLLTWNIVSCLQASL